LYNFFYKDFDKDLAKMTLLEELKRLNEQLGELEFKAKWVRLIFTNNEIRMP